MRPRRRSLLSAENSAVIQLSPSVTYLLTLGHHQRLSIRAGNTVWSRKRVAVGREKVDLGNRVNTEEPQLLATALIFQAYCQISRFSFGG